jgi:hypothetical protein
MSSPDALAREVVANAMRKWAGLVLRVIKREPPQKDYRELPENSGNGFIEGGDG